MGTYDHSVPSFSVFNQHDPKAINNITSVLGYCSTIYQCGGETTSRTVPFKENFRYKITLDNSGYRGIYETRGGIYKF